MVSVGNGAHLTQATFTTLHSTGTSASVTLQAPPGAYLLRQVSQETVSGRLTALNTPVEIQ